MLSEPMEGRKCFGFRGKRVVCCIVPTLLIAVAVLTGVLLTRPADDIGTEERSETDTPTAAGELSILKTGALTGDASGTLTLLTVIADNSSFLALNDFIISEPCDDTEIRLQQADDGDVVVVPLTGGTTSGVAEDFTEPLEGDFDAALYDQAALWCGSTSSLGDTADLVAPTTAGNGALLIREATLSGSSYTVEGLVQIVGSGSIVDDALVITYSLRFENIEVSSGPDVFLYLTTDADAPDDVDAEGSLRVELEGSERGTFSYTGNFTNDLPEGFVSPEDYVAAVVWCDEFSVFFGSGLFEDVV